MPFSHSPKSTPNARMAFVQINGMNAINQRYECHLGIPRAFPAYRRKKSLILKLTPIVSKTLHTRLRDLPLADILGRTFRSFSHSMHVHFGNVATDCPIFSLSCG